MNYLLPIGTSLTFHFLVLSSLYSFNKWLPLKPFS